MKIANPTARLGEDLAENYLKKLGYTILERNFRKGYGEIDIIALDSNILVFIEVKTRSSQKFGTPFEAITSWKLRTLINTAHFYKHTHPRLPESLRIDAISVILSYTQEVIEIEHMKNISGY